MRLIILLIVVLAHAGPVGKVIFTKGDAFGQQPNQKERRLVRGQDVYENDTLITKDNARLHVRFLDGAMWDLQSNTKMQVEQYSFTDGDIGASKSTFKLIEGGFKTLTGKIAEQAPDNYVVKTDIATMGVRGTYWGALLDLGQLYVSVFSDLTGSTRGVWIQNEVDSLVIGPKESYMNANIGGARKNIKGTLKPQRQFEVLDTTSEDTTTESSESNDEGSEIETKSSTTSVSKSEKSDSALTTVVASNSSTITTELTSTTLEFFNTASDVAGSKGQVARALVNGDTQSNLGVAAGIDFGSSIGLAVTSGNNNGAGENPDLLNGLSTASSTTLLQRVNSSLSAVGNNIAPTTHTFDDVTITYGRWSSPTVVRLFTDLSDPSSSTLLNNPTTWAYGPPTAQATLPTTGTRQFSDVLFKVGRGALGGELTTATFSSTVNFGTGAINSSFNFQLNNNTSWQGTFTGEYSANSGQGIYKATNASGTYTGQTTYNFVGAFNGFISGNSGHILVSDFEMKTTNKPILADRLHGVIATTCTAGC